MIMAYKEEHPWVWALALLPANEMVARVKTQQHWQSDVVVTAALGAAVGTYEYGHEKPWMVSLLPGGVFVGSRRSTPRPRPSRNTCRPG